MRIHSRLEEDKIIVTREASSFIATVLWVKLSNWNFLLLTTGIRRMSRLICFIAHTNGITYSVGGCFFFMYLRMISNVVVRLEILSSLFSLTRHLFDLTFSFPLKTDIRHYTNYNSRRKMKELRILFTLTH